jgi:stearoyl-CoA desaturase (delta-9 desaturase)
MHRSADERFNFIESLPILLVHLACLAVFWVGVSWVAVVTCLCTYFLRVFALTAGYHRYFSHHAFKTSRPFQFLLAFMAAAAAQAGPLWWGSHHRYHHRFADTEADIHSPKRRGFLWAHLGWLMCRKYAKAEPDLMKDFSICPELRLLERMHVIAPILLALAMYGLGAWMETRHPNWQTTAGQMVVWGFFISTVLVYHVTFSINSLMHMFGSRRFQTLDDSRNNLWLALLTMGEGWHNNHHRYPISARQGFFWWEIDLTYYVLKFLALFHVVWELRMPPKSIYEEAAHGSPSRPESQGMP